MNNGAVRFLPLVSPTFLLLLPSFLFLPDHKRIVNEWHGHVEKRFAATYKNTTNKRKNCGHVTAD
jgi:hypothetical protein